MASPRRASVINDFLASVHILAAAADDLLEGSLRNELEKPISRSQLRVLELVARTPGTTISEVAAFLGVTRPAASKSIDKLVRSGWVLREESAHDRRSFSVALSPRGTSLLEAYDELRHRLLEDLFSGFDGQQLEDVTELLDRISLHLAADRPDVGELCFRCGTYFRHRCLLRKERSRVCHYHLQEQRLAQA